MSIPKTSAGSGNIYLGSNLIAEGGCGKWQPGPNTIMYFPFEDDQLDHVGNATIDTSGTKQSLGYNFSSNGEMKVINGPSTCRFVLFFIKWNSSNGNIPQSPATCVGKMLYNFSHSSSSYAQTFEIEYTNGSIAVSNKQNLTTGIRYHMAIGYDGSKAYAYINGDKIREQSFSNIKTYQYIRFGYQINSTISQYIGEDRVWTQQEIQDYLRPLKSKYGIS